MDFMIDKDKLQELNNVISLYKKFDKYSAYTREELFYDLLPSFQLMQYKTIKEDDKVIGFANLAILNKAAEEKYKQTASLDHDDWQSGLRVWIIDIVSIKNTRKLMKWIINYFKKFLIVGERVNWLRIDEGFNVYRQSFKEKRSFHR